MSNEPPATNSRAWQHQLERTAKLEERVTELESALKETISTFGALENRIKTIEHLLSAEDYMPPYAQRDDTITLYTPHED